jgi:hypothetical protein
MPDTWREIGIAYLRAWMFGAGSTQALNERAFDLLVTEGAEPVEPQPDTVPVSVEPRHDAPRPAQETAPAVLEPTPVPAEGAAVTEPPAASPSVEETQPPARSSKRKGLPRPSPIRDAIYALLQLDPGRTTVSIAREVGCSEPTVKFHRDRWTPPSQTETIPEPDPTPSTNGHAPDADREARLQAIHRAEAMVRDILRHEPVITTTQLGAICRETGCALAAVECIVGDLTRSPSRPVHPWRKPAKPKRLSAVDAADAIIAGAQG